MMKMDNVKHLIKGILFLSIRPFIVPIIIITLLLILVSTITDIFYVVFNNEDKIDMQKEIKYYSKNTEYEKEEMKDFFASVWDFVRNIFGGGEMSNETDWPVERRTHNNKFIWV